MKKSIPTKLEVCATTLLMKGDKGLFQLEAFNEYGETDLRSVISRLINQHNIVIEKVPQPHVNRVGGSVQFKRYSVSDPKERTKLIDLINLLRKKRKAPCLPSEIN